MSWIGCVDTLSDLYISGWAADEADLDRELCAEIAVNSQVVARVPCAEFREDLRAAGIGDGCKGFHYHPSAHLKPGRNDLEVRYGGSDLVIPKGRSNWVRRREAVSAADGAFLAAAEAYHAFTPRDHICWIGPETRNFEQVLIAAEVPFRRYTVVHAAEPAAIRLPEKVDVLIWGAAFRPSPDCIRQLRDEHMNQAGLIAALCESDGAVLQMRLSFQQGGLADVKLESIPTGVCAFAEVGEAARAVGNAPPVLAHVHVPKCAGTSLRVLLERHFGARHLGLYVNDTYFVYGQETLRSYLLQDAHIAGFSSHHVRTFPRWLAGREVLYMTFLRDPIEQFVSYMTHIRKHYAGITAQSLLEAVPPDAPRLTLREFARWLLAADRDIPFRENHNVNFFARHSAPGAADRLAAAKSALSRFFFVGITERMDESMAKLRVLAGAAGVDFPAGPAPVENISRDFREDLSWINPRDEVGSLLLRSVEYDRQLYDWAVARFERQHQPVKVNS